jgi:hypothetical protein
MKELLKMFSMAVCALLFWVMPVTWPVAVIGLLCLAAGGCTDKDLN